MRTLSTNRRWPIASGVAAAAAALFASSSALARPVIYGVSAASVVQGPTASPVEANNAFNVTLTGADFTWPTTTGATFEDDVAIYARYANDDAWTRATRTDPWVRHRSFGSNSLGLSLIGLRAGYVELMVCRTHDGCSPSFFMNVLPQVVPVPASGPAITGTDYPFTVASGTPTSVTLYGRDIVYPTTNGFTLQTDTSVYAKYANKDEWTQLSTGSWLTGNGWTPTMRGVTLGGVRPGYVQFKICRSGGDCTQPFAWNVKPRFQEAAELTDVPPTYRVARVPETATSPFARFVSFGRTKVNGDDDSVWVGLLRVQAMGHPSAPRGYFYVPPSIAASTGAYGVRVETDAGVSGSGTLEVWDVPAGTVNPRSTTTTSDFTVQLAFTDRLTAPDTTRATITSPTCNVSATLAWTSDATRNVTLPSTCLSGWGSYDVTITTSNLAGDGVAVLHHDAIVFTPIPFPRFPFPHF